MYSILASNFGNLGAFVLGIPPLFFALLIGIPCALHRFRTTSVMCGVICLLAGALFLYSLPQAGSDFDLTVAVGVGGILAGISLIFFKRRRKESLPEQTS